MWCSARFGSTSNHHKSTDWNGQKKAFRIWDVRQLLTTSREYREYFAVFFKHNRFPTQENRFPLEDLAGCPHVLPVPCCSEFTKHIFKGLMIAYTDHIMKGNNRKWWEVPTRPGTVYLNLEYPINIVLQLVSIPPNLGHRPCKSLCQKPMTGKWVCFMQSLQDSYNCVIDTHPFLSSATIATEPVHDVNRTLTMNSTMLIDRSKSSLGLPHTWRWPTQNGDQQVIIVLNVQFFLLFGWQWPFQVGHLRSQIKATVLRRPPSTNKKRQIIYYPEVTILSWQALLYYWLPVMTLYISKWRSSIGHWWECTWAHADQLCKRSKNGQHKLKPCPLNPYGTP